MRSANQPNFLHCTDLHQRFIGRNGNSYVDVWHSYSAYCSSIPSHHSRHAPQHSMAQLHQSIVPTHVLTVSIRNIHPRFASLTTLACPPASNGRNLTVVLRSNTVSGRQPNKSRSYAVNPEVSFHCRNNYRESINDQYDMPNAVVRIIFVRQA